MATHEIIRKSMSHAVTLQLTNFIYTRSTWNQTPSHQCITRKGHSAYIACNHHM